MPHRRRRSRTLDLLNSPAAVRVAPADGLQVLRSAELEPPAIRAATQAVTPLAAGSPWQALVLGAAVRDADVTAAPLDVDVFLSDNEPADRRHFARVGLFRVRRFEGYLMQYLTQADDETLAAARERWATAIRKQVDRQGDAMLVYFKYRLEAYRSRHPDRPAPRQIILVERVYRILPPGDASGEPWSAPRTIPVARWQPDAQWPREYTALERYNPVTARFENVLK